MCVCVRVCVCLRERERERERALQSAPLGRNIQSAGCHLIRSLTYTHTSGDYRSADLIDQDTLLQRVGGGKTSQHPLSLSPQTSSFFPHLKKKKEEEEEEEEEEKWSRRDLASSPHALIHKRRIKSFIFILFSFFLRGSDVRRWRFGSGTGTRRPLQQRGGERTGDKRGDRDELPEEYKLYALKGKSVRREE